MELQTLNSSSIGLVSCIFEGFAGINNVLTSHFQHPYHFSFSLAEFEGFCQGVNTSKHIKSIKIDVCFLFKAPLQCANRPWTNRSITK